MLFLNADTSVTVRCGPFVSPTDGYTAVTNAAPTVYISKNHGAFAARNGTTWTHDRDGWYSCQLSAADTDTEGPLMLEVAGASTYLPVFMEFHVLPAQVFDSLITGTDVLDVNTTQVSGTAQTARDLGASVLLSPGTGTGQISLAAGAVTVGTNNDKTGYTASTVSDKTGYSLAASQSFNTSGSVGSVTGAVGSVTAAVTVGSVSAGAIDAAAIATGAIDADALAADAGTEIGTAVWATTTRALTDKVDFGLSTLERSSIADAVLDEPLTEPSATFAWASATLRTIVAWMGALSRNKLTQTSSTQTLRNDADTTDISTASVTDAAGTTTRGEWT